MSQLGPPLAVPVLARQDAGVETTRDVRDRGAYIPADADPERQRYWPPASRAMAIEWAREQRLREGGLAVDDATLKRVADAVMAELARPQGRGVGRSAPPPRLYYTPEEREENERGGVPPGLYDAVEDYLGRHPEINGGVEHGWHHGRRVLFVWIVGDAQPHRAALT